MPVNESQCVPFLLSSSNIPGSDYSEAGDSVSLSKSGRGGYDNEQNFPSCEKSLDHLRIDRSGHSSAWYRAAVYGLGWLPVLGGLLLAEQYVPVMVKLQEKGQLRPLADCLLTFVQLNTSWFRLPGIMGVLAIIAYSELAVFLLRGRSRCVFWSYRCVEAVGLMGLAAVFAILLEIHVLLLPTCTLPK
jgi:hypothetical protein